MTKRLLLMRHGKSDWGKVGQEDFERPLAPRGRKATRRVAAWILKHAGVPDAVLVSAARRTEETWRLAAEMLAGGATLDVSRDLYLASPGDLINRLSRLDDATETALVVGHNPGLELLAHLLAGPDSDSAAVADLARGFPTAGLAVFELADDSWSRLGAGDARLVRFVRPRELK